VVHKPEKKTKSNAKEKASGNRKVKGRVFAPVNDIAGEAAEAEGQTAVKIEKKTQRDKDAAEKQEYAAEFALEIHRRKS
jgi:hypothetical protein